MRRHIRQPAYRRRQIQPCRLIHRPIRRRQRRRLRPYRRVQLPIHRPIRQYPRPTRRRAPWSRQRIHRPAPRRLCGLRRAHQGRHAHPSGKQLAETSKVSKDL